MNRSRSCASNRITVGHICSGNATGWAGILRSAVGDVGRGRLTLLEDRERSMKAEYP